MKSFLTVFEFELMNFVKAKSFIISTIIVAVLLGAATFAPRVIDMSSLLGTETNVEDEKEDAEEAVDENVEKVKLAYYDASGYFSEATVLEAAFTDSELIKMDSEKAVKEAVENEEAEAGFSIVDDLNYHYFVLNSDMSDENTYILDSVLATIHKQAYCESQGIDYASFAENYEAAVNGEVTVLGKDMLSNFWYCYGLVIIIFMIIIFYGVMIATSVTSEKSNRAIEVLVTSTNSTCLLFGKVFAAAVAAFIQVGAIMASALIGYSINHEAWGNKLDMFLDIPANVLVTFAVFGIGGFLFYAFLYGAMGALVSKTEDIQKSAGSLQMIIMVVYFAVLFQLQNVDGMIMKVCSFLPISSYSAMFVRIGMGKVETYEVIISAVILYASIVFTGWIGAKIYRMGTLRYGNPIKLRNALKGLKDAE